MGKLPIQKRCIRRPGGTQAHNDRTAALYRCCKSFSPVFRSRIAAGFPSALRYRKGGYRNESGSRTGLRRSYIMRRRRGAGVGMRVAAPA